MTGWGEKIPEISLDKLQRSLCETDDDGKAVKRLFAAIAYKQGISPAEFEETFGISKKSVYLWLDRIEERSLQEALYDETKPGRPSKLTEEHREHLKETLQKSPDDVGYDSQVWTPENIQHWIKTTYDIEYTRRHIRRLLKELDSN